MSTSESNGILCDEATYEASKDKISYDKNAKLIKVKGFDSEIRVYVPAKSTEGTAGLANKSWLSTSFIGRAREKTLVAELMQRVKSAKEKDSRVLAIEGEGALFFVNEVTIW
jgi:hypothetical protein